ncbi:leucine Rich Repeat [Seminavis robusta]|uniref:Leucine Rich Repeat n=1 Tax=Seminavis robusta TaxID=568900 RepID=A0A9N8EIJ5_9STRA|nr:leucine Rich Repeat [Seminavis robusta]|eukprot:Sro990_g228640.1 leucine Rich Repeat (462) ;mRNA; f:37952-39494
MVPTTFRDAVEAPKIEIALTIVLGKDYFQQVEESGEGNDDDLAEFMLKTRQKAFDWIVNHDPMQLEYNAPNLVQRFLLVLFYFQTTRHKPWKQCNPPAGSAISGLCYEPHHLTGEMTANILGDQWLSASHECLWGGVSCETVQSVDRTVVELRQYWNHLNGPLSWEITRLPQLWILALHSNMLTGVLPPRLFPNKAGFSLECLDLYLNQFSGTIPVEWVANLLEGNGKLADLNLHRNTLTGKIPSELGLLPLKRLILTSNTLTGSIPREIFSQPSHEWLFFGGNDLTGTLPSEVGLLTNLQVLNLNYTQISGSLPSEIGLSNQVDRLILSNTNMQGTIPEELYTGLDKLQFFHLDGCNFTGTISPSLGLLTRLQELHLSKNHFHGTIPNEIEALTGLAELLVNGNDLSGTFPVPFCQNVYTDEKLSKVVADCLHNPATRAPAIQCACCTSCCDETGLCFAT